MTSTATGLGGVDEIVTGDGADYVIAGVGADRVNYILDPTTGEPVQVGGDDAADYVVGDNGNASSIQLLVSRLSTSSKRSLLSMVATICIFVDEGPDVVLGGSVWMWFMLVLVISAMWCLGDNGEVDFDTSTVPGTALVETVTSTATGLGGVDEISHW